MISLNKKITAISLERQAKYLNTKNMTGGIRNKS
jgi:hypothetical protein